MLKVLVLGPASMLGRQFMDGAKDTVSLTAIGRTPPESVRLSAHNFEKVDLADEGAVREYVRKSDADVWMNFAANTGVDQCENDRPISLPDPTQECKDLTYRLNASLPRWLGEEAGRRGRRVLLLSTDAVFDGTRGPYGEEENPSPFGPMVGWYGFTKGVGELNLMGSECSKAIVRISYPFGGSPGRKRDIAQDLLARAATNDVYPLFTDQQITPTWIPDISSLLLRLTGSDDQGLFHAASPTLTTPFQFAEALFRIAGLHDIALRRSSLREAINRGERAPRPLNGGLAVRRVRALGVEPHDYVSAISAFVRAFPRRGNSFPDSDHPS